MLVLCMYIIRTCFLQLVLVVSKLLTMYRERAREIGEIRTLYQKEALQRKLLYNAVSS